MRLLARLLGLLFLAGAIGLLLRDLFTPGPMGSLGEVWYSLSPATLNLLQAGIQRHVAPELWDMVVLPTLLWPAVLVALVPAAVLLVLGFWPRRGR